jgi:hypothetical protein
MSSGVELMKAKLSTLVIAALAFAAPAAANPMMWYLDGVTFEDGAVAAGSFLFDASGFDPSANFWGSYSGVNIYVTDLNGDVFHYQGEGRTGGNSHEVSFGEVITLQSAATRSLFFDIGPGLGFADGIATFDTYFSGEYLSLGLGARQSLTFRNIISGGVTTVNPVAEPGPVLLLFTSLLMIGAFHKARRSWDLPK